MDPQMIQAMLAQGDQNNPEQQALQRKQAMIDAMRQKSMQMPQQQMAGRLVTPTWGQSLGNLAGGMMANKMQPGVDQGVEAQRQKAVNTRSQYLDSLMMAMRKNYPQQQQPVLPPSGMEDQ